MRAWLVVLAILALRGSVAEAKGCTERSHVVGLERCSWFAEWSRDANVPRWWIEIGRFAHDFRSQPFTLDPAMSPAASGDALHTGVDGLVARFIGGIGPWFYTGLELDPGRVASMPTVPGPVPADAGYFGMHAITGVHVSLFRLGLGAELAGGFRYETFELCQVKGCANVQASQSRRELEARVRADIFLDPRWSIGVSIGRSLIDRDDTSVIVSTSLHLRAIDGMR